MDRPGIERYNLRARKPRDYSHLHTTMKGALQRLHDRQCTQPPRDYSHAHIILEDAVMTQYSMKKGIQEFGEAGVEAVLKELQQLHDRKVLEPRQPETLSREEK